MRFSPMPDFTDSDVDRFLSHVARSKPYECWPWKASRFQDGYGQFKVGGRNRKAHRIAYFLHYGIDPAEQLVCHHCDNPVCCNPFHLFAGSEKDNIQDCRQKGRLNTASGDKHGLHLHPERAAKGERVHGSKVTFEQVRQIRELYAAGGITQEQLGTRFGMTRRGIGRIISGENWKHAIADGEPKSLSDPERLIKRGSSSHHAKLTESDVIQIRSLYSLGNPAKELASRFGVTVGTIYHIIRRLTWSHIP
jgi:DNA invertase Pin-like site-specific DNA recombinase